MCENVRALVDVREEFIKRAVDRWLLDGPPPPHLTGLEIFEIAAVVLVVVVVVYLSLQQQRHNF